MSEVTIEVDIEGTERVTEGFRQIGNDAADMGREIRHVAREISVLGASGVAVAKLGEQFGFLSKEQANVIKEMGGIISLSGTVVRALGYISDASWAVTFAEKARGAAHAFADAMASGITKIVGAIVGALIAIKTSSWAVALAEKARAIATAIANAVASWGIAVPIMIAAAAAAAAGILAATGKIPGLQYGGIVTKPTYALIGEREPEAVIPLSKITQTWASHTSYVNITINEAKTPRETGEAVIDALRRARVI